MPVPDLPRGIAAGAGTDLVRVVRLALPALAVLAAEPLYLLVDTAVVGHLGETELAGLAIGGVVLTVTAWFGTVLAYGTTGRAARRFGAGDRAAAVGEGVQACWLALVIGVVILVLAQLFAVPVARSLAGGPGAVAAGAAGWIRVASIGMPGLLVGAAGNGWLRGVQDTRRPMRYALTANLVSAALCPVLVYPAGLGLTGSAVANVCAQALMGLLFLRALVAERVPLRPHPAVLRAQLTLGRDLAIRGAAFQACFLSATAVAARFGPWILAAHQIVLQLWLFGALVLDAMAIAAQALTGAALGGDEVDRARALAWRIAAYGLAAGTLFGLLVLVSTPVLPGLFSTDPRVHRAALVAWPWFVAMQPLAGVVFALDGVLIGAGDARYMRNLTLIGALGAFLPMIWLTYRLRWGLGGIWAGLTLFIVVRLILLLRRLRSGRWAVAGASR